MNPSDALWVIAEISLGLVGFTGIVTVFRRPDEAIEGLDLVRSVHLLACASATLFLALLPSLLTAMGASDGSTWQIASGVMFLCSLVGFATNPWTMARLPNDPALSPRALVATIWVGACGNTILQLANALGIAGLPQLWPFLLGLLWYLLFCLIQFGGLLFLRPPATSGDAR